MMKAMKSVFVVFGCLVSVSCLAESAKEIPLWTDGVPGAKALEAAETYENGHVQHVQTPTLTVYLPEKDKANGAAVVICPGGAYWLLAFDHEGHEVAKWLNSIGVAGIIVKYRHRDFKHPVPMLDAQRAIRTVRFRAREWNIDPKRIGILGFSAGGHLASTAATHFDAGKPDAADPVERVSCRPDFAVLIYPVITFTKETMHRGSRNNLIGENPEPALIESLSNELQVTKETPPTFLVHSSDDNGVSPQNSIDFYLACLKAGVPVEMHIYEKGGHGYGLRADRCTAAADWPGRCEAWMRQRGFMNNGK
ncbi:MAG: alpha/beta hydrolase [Sedimentisphaerales bacterium]|nr:alpha/beta hydrolase [Sedimentisphaerales bacterium]